MQALISQKNDDSEETDNPPKTVNFLLLLKHYSENGLL